MSAAHPTAHLWMQVGLSSYRSACGMTAQRAPSGSTEAGHCSGCAVSSGVELPPLPADLRAWTRWRNADGTIGMRHPSGLKLGGNDAGALEAEARALACPLKELAGHGWRVFDDGGSYRAMAEGHEIISAPDLPRLALAAWCVRVGERGLPDLPDALIDGLYLAGHDPVEVAGRGLPLGELRYLAGVVEPTPGEVVERAAMGEVVERAATQPATAEPIPIAVYAPSVTYLSAIRTALMTNDRAGAIRITLDLLGVLVDADLRIALYAAIAALDEEGRAGLADPLRGLVA
jgi:hypothetical protein